MKSERVTGGSDLLEMDLLSVCKDMAIGRFEVIRMWVFQTSILVMSFLRHC